MKKTVRCTYLSECFLAEELECYGFKADCPLYMRANDKPCNEARFDYAMDKLIWRTKQKHERLQRRKTGEKRVPSQPGVTKTTS